MALEICQVLACKILLVPVHPPGLASCDFVSTYRLAAAPLGTLQYLDIAEVVAWRVRGCRLPHIIVKRAIKTECPICDVGSTAGLPLNPVTGQLENLYGFLGLIGVVVFALAGMLYKIIPFLVGVIVACILIGVYVGITGKRGTRVR